jgi:hypothetical protein
MTDTAQLNLREPAKVDWDNLGNSSTFLPPPPALDENDKPITYQGIVADVKTEADRDGYLQFVLDPVKLVKTPTGKHDGYEIRFTRASVAPFTKLNPSTGEREPMKGNPNAAAKFLKSTGLQAKPQTNSEYQASAERVKGKPALFTIDWEAYNKDTGERVKGFKAFPIDPERPGQRKAILRKGDVYNVLDSKGQPTNEVKTVESEILFANAKVKFFQDPTRQRG